MRTSNSRHVWASLLAGVIATLAGFVLFQLVFDSCSDETADTAVFDSIVFVSHAIVNPVIYLLGWLDSLGRYRVVISNELYFASPLFSGIFWAATVFLLLKIIGKIRMRGATS